MSRMFVAHALELDVSSCGGTKDKAAANLKEAVRVFLEKTDMIGTLQRILQEAGVLRPVVIPRYAAVPIFVRQEQSPNRWYVA